MNRNKVENKNMNTFKFNACETCPLDIAAARKLCNAWAKRRAFPVEIVSVTALQVFVQIDAPSNRMHNRSVQSLASILQRHLDRQHFVLSRLVPTLECKSDSIAEELLNALRNVTHPMAGEDDLQDALAIIAKAERGAA